MDEVSLNDIENYVAPFNAEQSYKTLADKYLHFVVKQNEHLRTILSDREKQIINLIKDRETAILEGIKRGTESAGTKAGTARGRHFAPINRA